MMRRPALLRNVLVIMVSLLLAGISILAQPLGDACTVNDGSNSLMRSGSSLADGIVTVIPAGRCDIDITSRRTVPSEADGVGRWIAVEWLGYNGWIASTRLIVTNTEALLTDTPPPQPTATSTRTPIPTVVIPPTVEAALTSTARPAPVSTPSREPGITPIAPVGGSEPTTITICLLCFIVEEN